MSHRHAAKVGESVFLCSHANLSGNNKIGDFSYIGPGANVPNRISIFSNVKLSIGSTATTDIPKDSHFSGNFAIPIINLLKIWNQLTKKLRYY